MASASLDFVGTTLKVRGNGFPSRGRYTAVLGILRGTQLRNFPGWCLREDCGVLEMMRAFDNVNDRTGTLRGLNVRRGIIGAIR